MVETKTEGNRQCVWEEIFSVLWKLPEEQRNMLFIDFKLSELYVLFTNEDIFTDYYNTLKAGALKYSMCAAAFKQIKETLAQTSVNEVK